MRNRLFQLIAVMVITATVLSACGPNSFDANCANDVRDWSGCLPSSEVAKAWLISNGYDLPVTAAPEKSASQPPAPSQELPPAAPTATPAPPTAAPAAAAESAVSTSYPLADQSYDSPEGSAYNAVWTADGRLWQPQLPTGAERIAHTVAITIEEGTYTFDGVECQLFVDAARNGAGASNPVTAEYGNDLGFTVDTADGGQAWGLVQCRGNASSGFQIRWLGQ